MVVTFIKPKTKTNGKLQAAYFCNDTVCYNRNDEECHRLNHAKNIHYTMPNKNSKFTFPRVLIMRMNNYKRSRDIR